jgi:hypothetical protein
MTYGTQKFTLKRRIKDNAPCFFCRGENPDTIKELIFTSSRRTSRTTTLSFNSTVPVLAHEQCYKTYKRKLILTYATGSIVLFAIVLGLAYRFLESIWLCIGGLLFPILILFILEIPKNDIGKGDEAMEWTNKYTEIIS